jgi:hypothetical protein
MVSQRRSGGSRRQPLLMLLAAVLLGTAVYAGWQWLSRNPQHNPYAPLSLAQPVGWATADKLAALAGDGSSCRKILRDNGIDFAPLPRVGTAQCVAADRTRLADAVVPGLTLQPVGVAPSCAVNAALILWTRERVQPAAQRHFGQAVARMEHLGSYNCRRIGGGDAGNWSEHSSGNAIDIAAFVLADGTRISLIDDWRATPDGRRSRFLADARNGACELFATTLSPDYNRAHADHFHLDLAQRAGGWNMCH